MPLTSPPFAPGTLRALQALAVRSHEDLRRIGAVKTFLLLKAGGLTATRSILWQLSAACRGIRPAELNEADKQALLAEMAAHPPVDIFPPEQEMAGFMRQALIQAELAAAANEVPVGAVVVKEGRIIAAAHNLCASSHNISQHAEIRALSQAGAALQNYRLDGCDVYITLEPCNMCSGTLVQARVRRVIFGATEPKTGAAGSIADVFSDRHLNPHTAVLGGILAEECRALLQQFFQNRRGN